MYNYLTTKAIHDFIRTALLEDVGDGDHSTLSCVPADAKRRARMLIKDEGILAGVELANMIFAEVDPTLEVNVLIFDGHHVSYGDIALIVEGNARSILTAERLVLNCAQRMSGIATDTHRAVQFLQGTSTKILDTRKTTPNFRIMEKWAVRIGGGENHRYGLFDMIMLKDNHVDFAGGIAEAIAATHYYLENTQKDLKIEIETRNLDEVAEVLRVGGVHRIMLDNMDIPTMRKAVEMIDGKYETEASGGIQVEQLNDIAQTGVDYISMGALTHSHRNFDISLKAF